MYLSRHADKACTWRKAASEDGPKGMNDILSCRIEDSHYMERPTQEKPFAHRAKPTTCNKVRSLPPLNRPGALKWIAIGVRGESDGAQTFKFGACARV